MSDYEKAREIVDDFFDQFDVSELGRNFLGHLIAAALKEAVEAENERCINVLTEFASDLRERGYFQDEALLEDGIAAIRSSKTESEE